jgi:hypothetical protein
VSWLSAVCVAHSISVSYLPGFHEQGSGEKYFAKRFGARGDMENRIKEQLSLFADRTTAGTIKANQLRLHFSAIAYALVASLQSIGSDGNRTSSSPGPNDSSAFSRHFPKNDLVFLSSEMQPNRPSNLTASHPVSEGEDFRWATVRRCR